MKIKLILGLILICCLAHTAIAQRIDLIPVSKNGVGTRVTGGKDTTSGADTNYIEFKATLPYDVHFTHTNTKVSGTVAGTTILLGSDDGIVWFNLVNTTTGLDTGQVTDAATLGNATEVNHWFYGGSLVRKFLYYRLRSIYSNGVSAPIGKAEAVLPTYK